MRARAARALVVTLLAAVPLLAWLPGRAAERPSDAKVLRIVTTHCVPCHAADPAHPAFAKPPAGIVLEGIDQIARYAPRIKAQVVDERAMPLGNETGMTDAERAAVGAWIEGRKP
jgi:uncharacterized membrane protein